MMGFVRLLAAASGALLLACASGPEARPSARDATQFVLHAPSSGAISARAAATPQGGTLTGPQIQVQWDAQRVEGRAFGQAVSFSVAQGQISGLYGGAPVRLQVSESDDRLHVRGLFGGQISNLRVSTAKVEGTIGRCSYDLAEFDGLYQGFRRCAGRGAAEPVWMTVPDALTGLPNAVVAASLGMLMGSG